MSQTREEDSGANDDDNNTVVSVLANQKILFPILSLETPSRVS